MNQELDKYLDKEITILTGGGRCGTQFFGEHMDQISERCFSVHEPDILHPNDPDWWSKLRTFGAYQLIFGKLLRRRGFRSLSIQADNGSLDSQEIRKRMRLQRIRYFQSRDAQCVVESNAAWWGITEYADEIGSNVRVAVIMRHPVSWIESWLRHGGLHDSNDLVRRLKLGRIDDTSWDNDPAIRLAHSWARIYGRLSRCCDRLGNHRLFRFEDVFGKADETSYNELVRFIRHDHDDMINWSLAHQLRGKPQNQSVKADDSGTLDVERIWSICGDVAELHGYKRFAE